MESRRREKNAGEIKMTPLAKMFLPSKDRLLYNAKTMMDNAQDPWFKQYWTKVYIHLCKQYKKLH